MFKRAERDRNPPIFPGVAVKPPTVMAGFVAMLSLISFKFWSNTVSSNISEIIKKSTTPLGEICQICILHDPGTIASAGIPSQNTVLRMGCTVSTENAASLFLLRPACPLPNTTCPMTTPAVPTK